MNSTSISGFKPNDTVKLLSGFSFINDPIHETPPAATVPSIDSAVKTAIENVTKSTTDHAQDLKSSPFAPPPLANICAPNIAEHLTVAEQEWVNDESNKRMYAAYRFDRGTGNDGGGPFNDSLQLVQTMVPVTWPTRIEFKMASWSDHNILRSVQVIYDQLQIQHGSEGTVSNVLTVDLVPGEIVNNIKLGKGPPMWGVEGVAFVEVHTTLGKVSRIGDEGLGEVIDYYPYDGFPGLKGFWGACGDVIDKLGPIWG